MLMRRAFPSPPWISPHTPPWDASKVPTVGFRVKGSGFRVYDLGFKVKGLGSIAAVVASNTSYRRRVSADLTSYKDRDRGGYPLARTVYAPSV